MLRRHIIFWGINGSNAEKWVDHQKKKFFVNNFVEDLIPFKEEHQGLLKLPVRLRRGREASVWGKNGTPNGEFSRTFHFISFSTILFGEQNRNILLTRRFLRLNNFPLTKTWERACNFCNKIKQKKITSNF